jgi:hypothetical protein
MVWFGFLKQEVSIALCSTSSCVRTLIIGYDLNSVAPEDGNARVRGAKIDSNCRHGECLQVLCCFACCECCVSCDASSDEYEYGKSNNLLSPVSLDAIYPRAARLMTKGWHLLER